MAAEILVEPRLAGLHPFRIVERDFLDHVVDESHDHIAFIGGEPVHCMKAFGLLLGCRERTICRAASKRSSSLVVDAVEILRKLARTLSG